jgi:alpha-mannosidase
LLVGPWYTQPDEFLVSGEAMVRNLLLGRRMAHNFGACMDLGYLPDSFGHAGQMPQIFAGFGFPAAIVFRGITADQARSAFIWRGSDGTALLTLKLPDDDAYSNYLYRLRVTLSDPAPINQAWLDAGLACLRSDCESQAVCDQFLWMDGVDHIFPNPKTPDIIDYANQTLKDAQIVHSTLPAYVDALKAAAPQLDEQRGELRHANRAWTLQAVLANVASSHLEVKQANVKAQTALERVVEPLCSLAWLYGAEYPRRYLESAWKLLLQNHCHDSICGCSVDQVHRDMRYRYDQIMLIAGVLQARAQEYLAAQVDTSFASVDECVLLAFNPLPWARQDIMMVDVEMPAATQGDVCVYNRAGEHVPAQVLGIREVSPLRQPRYDIPTPDHKRIYHLALPVQLAPYAFAAFRVVASSTPQRPQGTLFTATNTLENKWVRVTVEADGSLTVHDKRSGRAYRGLLAFEDRGDGGEGWNWIPPTFDQTFGSAGAPVVISRVQDGPLVGMLKIDVDLRVPEGFVGPAHEVDRARMQRSATLVDLPVEIMLSLNAYSPRIDLRVTMHNQARNHRLRMLFPTDINANVCHADGAFDVVERNIAQVDSHDWREPQLGTYPHQSFVAVKDAQGGLAVLTAGTHEYEVIDEPRRTIAITLLRAFGRGAGEPHEYIDSQMLGTHTLDLALLSFTAEDGLTSVMRAAREFTVPLPAMTTQGHAGVIALDQPLFAVEGQGVDVTAVKLCEERATLLLRMVNLSDEEQNVVVSSHVACTEVYRLTLAEERQERLPRTSEGGVALHLMPRQIATVEWVPAAKPARA